MSFVLYFLLIGNILIQMRFENIFFLCTQICCLWHIIPLWKEFPFSWLGVREFLLEFDLSNHCHCINIPHLNQYIMSKMLFLALSP